MGENIMDLCRPVWLILKSALPFNYGENIYNTVQSSNWPPGALPNLPQAEFSVGLCINQNFHLWTKG